MLLSLIGMVASCVLVPRVGWWTAWCILTFAVLMSFAALLAQLQLF